MNKPLAVCVFLAGIFISYHKWSMGVSSNLKSFSLLLPLFCVGAGSLLISAGFHRTKLGTTASFILAVCCCHILAIVIELLYFACKGLSPEALAWLPVYVITTMFIFFPLIICSWASVWLYICGFDEKNPDKTKD